MNRVWIVVLLEALGGDDPACLCDKLFCEYCNTIFEDVFAAEMIFIHIDSI